MLNYIPNISYDFLEVLWNVFFFFMNLLFVFWNFKTYCSVNDKILLDAKRALFTVVSWVVHMLYNSLSTNTDPEKCLNLCYPAYQ